MNSPILSFKSTLKFSLIYVLYIICFVLGSMALIGEMPTDIASEPGLMPEASGFLLIAFINTLIICALILASRYGSLKHAMILAFSYYGAVTFVMQIETWYFLSSINISLQLLSRIFIMGIPTAFILIPLAVWILGRGNNTLAHTSGLVPKIPIKQYIWKFLVAAIIYLILYLLAGYFIAWQNSEVRAFYGRPGEPLPFLSHIVDTLHNDPLFFPFQLFRGCIWALCALPIIRGSSINPWGTALLVGLFLSLPQNLVHLLENPLMPIASVRFSHLIETIPSTFIFGVIAVWLFHREHYSFRDLISMPKRPSKRAAA